MLPSKVNFLDKQITIAFYNDLIEQLNKDLTLSGIDFKIPLNCKPNILIAKLSDFLIKIIVNDQQKFNRFMYILDISEKKILAIKETQLNNLTNHLVQLILERVFQKVYLRQKMNDH